MYLKQTQYAHNGIGLLCFGLLCFGLLWFALLWFALLWFDLLWFDLLWFAPFYCLLHLVSHQGALSDTCITRSNLRV